MSAARPAKRKRKRQWVRKVTTDSTKPPPKTFAGSASTIARKMARKDVSPKGLGSGIRMIQYFINRGGKNLPPTRRRELERAKRILQRRAATQQQKKKTQAQKKRRAGVRTRPRRRAGARKTGKTG